MEIDVRGESGDKPDVIRFGDNKIIECFRDGEIIIKDEDGDIVYIHKRDIPNLIKALKKYQELYGE